MLGKTATGVRYIDADGREVEQPADIVVLSAFQMHNVRLLLLSGIGIPYDPVSGHGMVGKNYAYQMCSVTAAYFSEDVEINPFIGAGSAGQRVVDEFNSDHFDHTGHGFIGGSLIYAGATGGRPIDQMMIPPATPKWGQAWKTAVRKHYRHSAPIGTQGSVMSYRDRYLSLDPTYRDAQRAAAASADIGLARITSTNMAAYSAAKMEEIVRAMKPRKAGDADHAEGRPLRHAHLPNDTYHRRRDRSVPIRP